jgi:hypothetical protein
MTEIRHCPVGLAGVGSAAEQAAMEPTIAHASGRIAARLQNPVTIED